jgi:hypothetical protein
VRVLPVDPALSPTPMQQGAQFTSPGSGAAGSLPGPGRTAADSAVPELELGHPELQFGLDVHGPLPTGFGDNDPAGYAQQAPNLNPPGQGSQWPQWADRWTQL